MSELKNNFLIDCVNFPSGSISKILILNALPTVKTRCHYMNRFLEFVQSPASLLSSGVIFSKCDLSAVNRSPACLPVRYAMTDHVVHRCTDWLGESSVSERGWVGVVLDCLLVHDEVYFICCHTNLEETEVIDNCYIVFCTIQKHKYYLSWVVYYLQISSS